MTNPFDDLESDASDETDDGDAGIAEQDPEPEPVTERTSDRIPSSNPIDPAGGGPAFEYSEVRQRPLYARAETWDEFEDQFGIVATPELRRMGIRDEETREIHDALLEIAIEHVDELPERIADKRRES